MNQKEVRAKRNAYHTNWHKNNPDKYREYYAKMSRKHLLNAMDDAKLLSPELCDALIKGGEALDKLCKKRGVGKKQKFDVFF